jgi:RecJ-like exonuclease
MSLKDAKICTACGKHRTQHSSGLCAHCRMMQNVVYVPKKNKEESDIKSEFDV